MKFLKRSVFSNRRNLFTKLMLSQLIIIFISLLIGTVLYHISVNIIEYEITKAHYNSLNLVKNIIDKELKELDKLYIQIGFNPKIQLLMTLKDDMKPEQLIDMAKLDEEVKRFKLAYPVIKNFYIYFNRSKIVMSDEGKYSLDVFNESILNYDTAAFNKYIAGSKPGMNIYTLADTNGCMQNVVAYVKPLPIGRSDGLGKLVIIIDDKLIKQTMEELQWIDEEEMLIINNDDKIIINNNASGLTSNLSYASLEDSTVIDSQKNTVVSYIESDFYKWKYVSVIPKHMFFKKAEKLKQAILYCLIFLIITGFIAAYHFAKKYYGPVHKLVNFIQVNLKKLKTQDEDEYHFIQNILTDILDENENYIEKVSKEKSRLKNDFLLRIIKGRLDSKAMNRMQDIYNISISDSKQYTIILIYFDDTSLISFDEAEETTEESLEIARMLIVSTLDKLINQKFNCEFIHNENTVVCMVDKPCNTASEAADDIKDIMGKFLDIIKNKLEISISTSVSGSHKGYDGIKKAYKEAEKAMEYYMLLGKEQVAFFDCLKFENPRMISYDYKRDVEQFIQSITAKDIKSAKVKMKEIFFKWFDGTPPVNVIRYRMNEMVNSFINSTDCLKFMCDESFSEHIKMMDVLLECRNVDELQNELDKILVFLEEQNSSRDSIEPDLHQKVIEYINDNFYRSDLNISSIADNFNVNIPYLSKQFKKRMGIGPFEYLQLIRVENAKRLLKESNDSVKEIIGKTGFTYEVSFIRVFKKYEGITPGVYRNKNHS